ncbi:uncharacterized protein BYT42DRAFT_630155, partial [Radiomyces spectabilis]|uniref:uncharacterized protein n=1 Tax=Radiomyces spectabilis TaxID=64574 RepID=UPI002220000B
RGIALDDVVKLGNWTSPSTFQPHDRRNLHSEEAFILSSPIISSLKVKYRNL